MKKYNTVNGTSYNLETKKELIKILEKIRMENIRIELDFGDVKTNKSWGELYDIKGSIGRSGGKYKIPILLYNSRSSGGSAILDHCIIGIKTTKEGKILYKNLI